MANVLTYLVLLFIPFFFDFQNFFDSLPFRLNIFLCFLKFCCLNINFSFEIDIVIDLKQMTRNFVFWDFLFIFDRFQNQIIHDESFQVVFIFFIVLINFVISCRILCLKRWPAIYHILRCWDFEEWSLTGYIIWKILDSFQIITKHSSLILFCPLIIMFFIEDFIIEYSNDQKSNQHANTRCFQN